MLSNTAVIGIHGAAAVPHHSAKLMLIREICKRGGGGAAVGVKFGWKRRAAIAEMPGNRYFCVAEAFTA